LKESIRKKTKKLMYSERSEFKRLITFLWGSAIGTLIH